MCFLLSETYFIVSFIIRKSHFISDNRCLNVFINLGLIEERQRLEALDFLSNARIETAQSIRGDGNFSNKISKNASNRIQYFMLLFQGKLGQRYQEVSRGKSLALQETTAVAAAAVVQTQTETRAQILSEIKVIESAASRGDVEVEIDNEQEDMGGDNEGEYSDKDSNSNSDSDSLSSKDVIFDSKVVTHRPNSFPVAVNQVNEKSVSESPKTRLRKTRENNLASVDAIPARRPSSGSGRVRKKSILSDSPRRNLRKSALTLTNKQAGIIHGFGKADILSRKIINVCQRVWLKSAHLALIISFFTIGKLPKTVNFGSYRVDLVCVLFNRLVDVQNFDLVIKVLKTQEIACVYSRIGMLSVFNPMKPEGWHCLNLASREERIIAKMLILLSVEEPGKNWIDSSFRWKYDAPSMPGWELPERWLTDKHLPHHGFVHMDYYCGGIREVGRQGADHCKAHVALRKSLLYLVSGLLHYD